MKPRRIQRKRTRAEWLKSPNRPRATCHPERPHQAREMCKACYDTWLYANSLKRNANVRRKNNEWRQNNKDKVKADQRRQKLRVKYGLTPEQYNQMFAAQSGKCLLCNRGDLPLAIDHCHDTGRIRGLLCLPCNGSLGWVERILRLKETPWISAAMSYLEQR